MPPQPATPPTVSPPRDIVVETLPLPERTTISLIKIKIIENTPEKLVIGFDYFTPDGQLAHFSNASCIAVIEIFPETDPSIKILATGTIYAPGIQQRASIKPPEIRTSEDTITIPRSILDLQGVDSRNLILIAHVKGDSEPPISAQTAQMKLELN